MLPQRGGEGSEADQRRDREAAPPGQEGLPPGAQASAARYETNRKQKKEMKKSCLSAPSGFNWMWFIMQNSCAMWLLKQANAKRFNFSTCVCFRHNYTEVSHNYEILSHDLLSHNSGILSHLIIMIFNLSMRCYLTVMTWYLINTT